MSDRARRAREAGRTFSRARGDVTQCAHCEQPEREHLWICDGCGEELTADPRSLLPILHVSENPWAGLAWEEGDAHGGATLCCNVEGLS